MAARFNRLAGAGVALVLALAGTASANQRGPGFASAPFPMVAEVTMLTTVCVTYLEMGDMTDVTAHGYVKYPRNFYYKGLHKDDLTSRVGSDQLVGASIGYSTRRSCDVGASALGDKADTQAFMRSTLEVVEARLGRTGYSKYSRKTGTVWIKGNTGVTLHIVGTPGSRAVKVTFSAASRKTISRALAPNG